MGQIVFIHCDRLLLRGRWQGSRMATKHDLTEWILMALRSGGGELHHIRVAELVWERHESDLRESGDLFFTWQYDLRWAAQDLRDSGLLQKVSGRSDGIWRLGSV